MEGGGDEERMQEVAPDLNGTLEDNDVDDEEQGQQDAAVDDEPQHADEEEHTDGFQNGGSAKDAMEEMDFHGSQGKASGSGGKIFIGGLSWDTSTGMCASLGCALQ